VHSEQGSGGRLPGARGWRAIAVGVVAGSCLLGAVSTASASKLFVDSGGTLRFAAGPGEVNRVDATDLGTGGRTVVTDPGSIVRVGPGCVAVTLHQGSCKLPAGNLQDMTIDLADQSDSAQAFKLSDGSIAISGGTGDDTIMDRPQSGANVSGGAGDDTITVHPNFGGRMAVQGDGGNDSITALSASGSVDGGAGNDTLTLTSVINAPGGSPSAAFGAPGNDHLFANGATSVGLLDGGDGSDRITTDEFATATTIDAGAGKDVIRTKNLNGGVPFVYPATLYGGAGPDLIDGGGAGDTLDCGAGVDHYKLYVGDVVTGCEVAF
jgi:Ca2+-binding RTX toxin-like protein